MSAFDKLANEVSAFFEQKPDASMQELAEFGAPRLSRAAIIDILEYAITDERLLEYMGEASYMVSPNFLKLFIHRDQATGWGLRIHAFTPGDTKPLNEPWHEHRWNLVSSVLKGAVHSENAFAHVRPEDGGDTTTEGMHYYSIPDKRAVGSIKPEFKGMADLDNMFPLTVSGGQTYAHQSELAHHLTLQPEDGTTITTVITAPPNRPEAAFIEPMPLEFKERNNPIPLGHVATALAIQSILEELRSQNTASQDPVPVTPVPNHLYVVGDQK